VRSDIVGQLTILLQTRELLPTRPECATEFAMSKWIHAAKTGDLKPGEAKIIAAGDREIALFNVNGQFHAIDNLCPHRGGPLGDGVLEGNVVICPWHGWRFDVTSGKSPVMPVVSVEKFEVAVEGDDVKVKVN